jgi:hypothetical protein
MASKAKVHRDVWRPPEWIPILLALMFGAAVLVAIFIRADWRVVTALGGLFGLTFRTAFRGFQPF